MKRPADHDGVPMCSHVVCPQYDGKRCELIGAPPDSVCVPAVRDMHAELVVLRKK